MNWREILSNSNDLDINMDLLVCADWCDENGRENAAMKLREWAQKEIVIIDEEPFIVERHDYYWFLFDLRSLFDRTERIHIGLSRTEPEGFDEEAGGYFGEIHYDGMVTCLRLGKRQIICDLTDSDGILDAVRIIRKQKEIQS